MNQQINAMQESIKIALDAADAATDVTSEYKELKMNILRRSKSERNT